MQQQVAEVAGVQGAETVLVGGVEFLPPAVGKRLSIGRAELVGLQSNFTILDTDDQLRLMKQLISASNLDEKRWPARQLAGLIDQWKNRGLTPAQLGAADAEAFANG
ncbi:MAG: UvrD-helicase domain-containing protein, partial [Sphingomicrobium sp.]